MNISILLAKFIGPFIIIIGMGLFVNLKVFSKIIEDFSKSPGLIYVIGLGTFIAGLAIVLFHNLWVANWRVIITIFGWVALIKGVWLVILPQTTVKITEEYLKNIRLVLMFWAIIVMVGIFLTLKGYL